MKPQTEYVPFIMFILLLVSIACGLEPVATDTPVWTEQPTSTSIPTQTQRPPVLAKVYVVTDSLNLRERPCEDDTTCPPVFQMPAGTLVGLDYDRGDWVLVRVLSIPVEYTGLQVFVGRTGWCAVQWLEENK